MFAAIADRGLETPRVIANTAANTNAQLAFKMSFMQYLLYFLNIEF